MKTYRLFGMSVESDFDFRTPLSLSQTPPDLHFACVSQPPEGLSPPSGPATYESDIRLESGAPFLALYPAESFDLLRFSEVADFYVSDRVILCHLIDPAYQYTVEIRLLGTVFAFWFERRGVPMLHASAVVADGRAAVFMATNSGGKSSLAATLMQAGCPLLSDDLVGLQASQGGVEGRPGYPAMRFWPDQTAHFFGSSDTLDLVHPNIPKHRLPVGPGGFGRFFDAPIPIGCIYLPERHESGTRTGRPSVEVVGVAPRQAVIELVRGSFLPDLVERAGLAPHRLPLLARLSAQMPVKRLIYPTGMEFLPIVRDAILADLRGSSRARPRAIS
jgi:hypothetical protein